MRKIINPNQVEVIVAVVRARARARIRIIKPSVRGVDDVKIVMRME